MCLQCLFNFSEAATAHQLDLYIKVNGLAFDLNFDAWLGYAVKLPAGSADQVNNSRTRDHHAATFSLVGYDFLRLAAYEYQQQASECQSAAGNI